MRILLLFLFCFSCFAADLDQAIKMSTEAFLQYPNIKKATKKLEKKVMAYSPMSEEYTKIITPTVLSLMNGEINTERIKKMNIKVLGGILRPDIKYNFKDKYFGTTAKLKWDF